MSFYSLKNNKEYMENNPTNIRINPTKYPNIQCECGNDVWSVGYILKRIPGIEMGTGSEDQILDLAVYYCSKCGKILPEYRKMYKLDDPADKENNNTTSNGLIL